MRLIKCKESLVNLGVTLQKKKDQLLETLVPLDLVLPKSL